MRRMRVRMIDMWMAVLALWTVVPAVAQAPPTPQVGLVEAGLALRQMRGVKRVLMIGAHPDDEDTPLLTVLARVYGAETAYLSLTRGDGGQNLIGPELWEGLGIIRTGELEAARALDGGRQFFTRAFDFGYSKTADEALTFWPRDEILRDMVWIIRRFRPHVIVSVWSGTPRDGHGQHQASGLLTREAFRLAGDPDAFPEQLAHGVEPWAPAKLYLSARRRGGGADERAAVIFQVGTIDPLVGRSPLQLSALSRSQHRSQDMGSAQPLGPRTAGGFLLESRVEGEPTGMFSGIDTTLVGAVSGLDAGARAGVVRHVEAYLDAVARAEAAFSLRPEPMAEALADALDHLRLAREAADGGPLEARRALDAKLEQATRAALAAAGVVVDVRADDDMVVPGQTVGVRVHVWNGGRLPLAVRDVALRVPEGWGARLAGVEGLGDSEEVAPAMVATLRFEVTVPPDADVSRLYYLRTPRQGAMYVWPDEPELWGLPRDPAPVQAEVRLALGPEAVPVDATRPWRYVGVDQATGEYYEPVLVVPAVSVRADPAGMVWPVARRAPRQLTVSLRAEAPAGASGTLQVAAPDGWSVEPASVPFQLAGAGAERTFQFELLPRQEVSSGTHVFRVAARTDDGRSYTEAAQLIDYPHVERAVLYRDADTEVTAFPVRVRDGLRVGYIMGTGDDGPEAIAQMGARVDLLTEAQVRDGAFDDYDVLVLGVRAYEAREDVRAVNDQILDFARAGGTVVVQYNQYQFSNGGYAPYPLRIGRPAPRVADETAPVRILEPDAPVFTTPNRITDEDFQGWVQERGLYFASEWDDAYTPLLELNDPGEPPRRGALLVAQVGDGVYAYAALSFFRQWAGRVPGAYRLFANLISLRADDWKAFLASR